MTIEDLKNVKLSPMTAGYLAIYIKLSDLCGEAAEVTEMDYGGSAVNEVNSEFDSALGKAQDEVMKLAVMSMTENLCTLSNNTELRTSIRRLSVGDIPLRSRGRPPGGVSSEGALYRPGMGKKRRIFDVRPFDEQTL